MSVKSFSTEQGKQGVDSEFFEPTDLQALFSLDFIVFIEFIVMPP